MPPQQMSGDQQQWLETALADWCREGIISSEQAGRILDRYESPEQTRARKGSAFSFVMSGIAALMMGLALLLLIGYNWDGLSRELKLIVIFGVILTTQGAAWYLRFVRGARRGGEILFFLGCLFYGAGIWLVAQVFHLDAHYPDGVWWWAIGVLPFALALDTLLLHCLLVALLAIWSGMEVLGFMDLGTRWLFGWWWMIPNGAFSLPLLAAPGVLWAYRKQSPAAVGMYAALGGWWSFLQMIAWGMEWQSVYFVGTLGAMYLVIAQSHRPGSLLAIPYRACGVVLVAGILIPMSFLSFHKEIGREISSGRSLVSASLITELTALLVLILVTVVLCAWLQPLSTSPRPSLLDRTIDLARRQWLPLCLAGTMTGTSFWISITGGGLPAAYVPTIAANLAMVGLAIWLIRLGLQEERGRPFAAGVLYFLLWTIMRYVDLFGDAGGMLGAAGMFFVCGATLFAVGRFWRVRKEVRHV